jgi:hypothetical protein
MKKLIITSELFLKSCKWTDLAMIKSCLCAFGIMAGIHVPKKMRKPFFIGSALVFVTTCVSLMLKFLPIMLSANLKESDDK